MPPEKFSKSNFEIAYFLHFCKLKWSRLHAGNCSPVSYWHSFCFLIPFQNTGSATGSAWQQTGSAFALLCHNVAPPLMTLTATDCGMYNIWFLRTWSLPDVPTGLCPWTPLGTPHLPILSTPRRETSWLRACVTEKKLTLQKQWGQ